ncbi:hypothetical protein L1787_20955 [Acuticoccus sp. M5D2P5]|uniref:hypothetical protein n=1 Tax=Acuticoccus kalidii TaxID=2910977 RepID=UPI001F205456|nr:hypothetical protein [Acuticoccus kalidii]MCF3935864.1 hypothetical protein [Acuticoccus kalidii]
MSTDSEIALRWLPLSDFPQAACSHWRMRSDSDFRLTVEGDFFVGVAVKTLVIEFSRVCAVAAHDDMGGKSMFGSETEIPMIGGESIARWPMLKIQNSRWLAAVCAFPEENSHFALLSYECTVEAIAPGEPEVHWK